MKTTTYYSPSGNPEVWEEGRQPAGYVTPEEWQAAHPAPEPEPPTAEELFAALRAAREPRLAEYDREMAQLQRQLRLATDAGATSVELDIAAWDSYAQALCDLPQQPGAPWDGGGDETPWPVKPERAEATPCA